MRVFKSRYIDPKRGSCTSPTWSIEFRDHDGRIHVIRVNIAAYVTNIPIISNLIQCHYQPWNLYPH